MITLEKIEAIRRRAIEVNPEIVELKFGCVFTGHGHHLAKILHVEHDIVRFVHCPNTVLVMMKESVEDCEIIGRPVRLADILLILQADAEKGHREYAIDSYGLFNDYATGDALKYRYDLLHDDLTLQKPEMIDFIYELIK